MHNINFSSPHFSSSVDLEKGQNSQPVVSESSLNHRIAEIFQKAKQYVCKKTTRTQRNLFYVLLTGSLSATGGFLAGEQRVAAAMGIGSLILGACLGGVANGLSTGISLETDIGERLSILEEKFDKLHKQVTQMKLTEDQIKEEWLIKQLTNIAQNLSNEERLYFSKFLINDESIENLNESLKEDLKKFEGIDEVAIAMPN